MIKNAINAMKDSCALDYANMVMLSNSIFLFVKTDCLIYSLPHISAFTPYRTAYLANHSVCGRKIVIDQGTCQRVSDDGVSFDIYLVKRSLHIKTEVETKAPRLGK